MFLVATLRGVSFRKEYDNYVPGQMAMIPKPEFFRKKKNWGDALTGVIHPGRLTWNIIMEVWKTIFLSKWLISSFHVYLPGCTLSNKTFPPVELPEVSRSCFERWALQGWKINGYIISPDS